MPVPSIPTPLHLQSVRALDPSGLDRGVLVRVRHMFSVGEDPMFSAPQEVEVLAIFGGAATKATEVTLTGLLPRASLNRTRFPTDPNAIEQKHHKRVWSTKSGAITVNAFEFRTFLVTK